MIKIVYLVSTLQKTGPTNILAGIVSHLDRKIYEPYVITLSEEKDPANSWITELAAQNVPIITLNLPRYRLGLLKRRIRQEISKIHPDLVHAQCFRSALLSACLLGNCKRVATVHCDFQEDFVMAYGKLMGKVMAWLYAKALKKMDCRICCSRMLAVLLEKKFPNMHFAYVDNGVDTNKFYPASDKQVLRKKLGLPEDKTIFIWAGAFIDRKDPFTLVRVINKLKEQSNLYFIFCGQTNALQEKCREACKECKNVLFTGHVSNLCDYMQASDCCISTSLSEGFHLTVYEALACGMPVILTKLDVYRELEKSHCALFFAPANAEELQQQISYLLQHVGDFSASAGAEFIRQGFSALIMSKKYQAYYKELLTI